MSNPILKELHDIRSQILAEHGDDLAGYLAADFAKTKASGHPVANIKQRSIRCNGAAKSGVSEVENLSPSPADR